MNKNVLFIGPYRQSCSWGRAAKAYIRAIVKSGANVTLRPIYMGTSIDNNIDPFFLALEQQKYDKYHAIIQNVLPHLLDYNSRFGKNIALFYTETSGWENTWPRKLNLMDEIWVPSMADTMNIMESLGLGVPIRQIPIPLDCSKFLQTYEPIDNLKTDTFKFYFIGELVERKNLDILIRAFHSEFDRTEPVDLILKVNRQGMNPDELSNLMNNMISSIKKDLRLYGSLKNYKEEIVIPEYIPEETLMRLHNSCDCFVMPSSGESWCMPVADALGFGKPALVVKNTGPFDMLPIDESTNYALSIESHKEKVIVEQTPLEDLYTGCETWYKPSQLDLQKKMRVIYTLQKTPRLEHISELCADRVFKFSEKEVAKLIGETL